MVGRAHPMHEPLRGPMSGGHRPPYGVPATLQVMGRAHPTHEPVPGPTSGGHRPPYGAPVTLQMVVRALQYAEFSLKTTN
jgi:hypothetical protein